ncbi:hypothetical protein FGG08_004010 [Glutinoglossum americanum]|uniref:Protein SDA1 n=1 Tax=Glutinoglossum americanum TaxID=1670608 RepID=A0A9P8L014_9PEZI|nr:hypothetical protein FGG08_004010 [Glutinoglossum americanum]
MGFFGMPRSFNKTLCHVIGDLSQIVNRYLLRDPGLSKMLAVTIDAFEESIPNLVSFASSPAGQSPWERVSNANVWRGSKETGEPDVAMETSLFPLLRNFLGHLATPSIMGQDFMNNYPEVLQDVWNLDYGLMYLIAGLPLWLPIPTLRRAARARERLNRQITELHRAMDIAEDGGDPGKEWRDLRDVGLVIKERHRVWRSHKIPPHLRADLPLLWAMNANAPSLTFWVILRILTNPSLVERIRAEIAPHVQVSQPHIGFGMTEPPRLKISMAGLRTGCPLLKSCYFETLRVDSAAWSVKRVVKDFVLTEDEKDARGGTKRSFALKTGEYINIPFGLHQSDPRYFHSPESFIGDRFLVQGADGKDEVDIGSLKPYGAGFAICKGRVFAEAEVLAFVASIIALWDFEPASAKGWEIPDHVKASGVALPKTDVRSTTTKNSLAMGKRKIGALEKVEADLSYREEFLLQYRHYESQRDIFMSSPSSATTVGLVSLRDLIDFLAHVAECYPALSSKFPEDLMRLLALHHSELEPELREKLVGSLVLLRKKEVIDSVVLLQTLFPILTTTQSKSLRTLLFQKILSDLRSSNAKTTNHRLNRTIQTVLFNLLTSDRSSSKGIWAVKLTRELWKRQIWTDSKAVEIMKEASLADNAKVAIGGVRFFLGGDKERQELDDESSDEDDGIDLGKLKHQTGVTKKTKKKAKTLNKAIAAVKRKERKKNQPHPLNFSAFHLLYDPQGLAESLFSKHLNRASSKLNLEQKLLVLQLVSRLVGLHKLTIISLYSYFLRYLTPRQPSVTSFLASLAQASHSLVPPDVLEPLIQKIANEFVSEAAAAEVASAGLNAIREICARQPLAMNGTLLQDLVMYRKSKDKGTVMAARGLLGLYREVGADMLRKRDRGKEATIGLKSGGRKEPRFGEVEGGEIEGLELLEEWKAEQRRKRREEKDELKDGLDEQEEEDEEDWGAWDVEEDDSDSSGGWINVDSEDEIEISDDDDKPPVKRARTREESLVNGVGGTGGKRDIMTSSLATTRILTPADLAKLQELKVQASVDKLMGNSKRQLKERDTDSPLTAADIESVAFLSAGKDKEARLAKAAAGRDGREDFKSKKAKKQEAKTSSTTNKQKARKKNFLMTLGKAKGKQKRSLVETRKALRGHLERQKRGGKRGNQG